MILDFEGEPGRPLLERRRKRSPLRDVAGMLRSFAYAASGSAAAARGERPGGLGAARRASGSSRATWRRSIRAMLPAGESAVQKLLAIFELERAMYELRYELNNRPDWVGIPVACIAVCSDTAGVSGARERDGHRGTEQERGREMLLAIIPTPTTCWAPTPRAPGFASPSTGPEAEAVLRHVDGEAEDPAAAASRGRGRRLLGRAQGAALPLRYELEVRYPDGGAYRLRDPYAFLPSLGELDLYLLGEGRHEELYERLGAHSRTLDGVGGTSFAVWARRRARSA